MRECEVDMFGASRKDEVFYGAFRDQAATALDAAEKLAGMLRDLTSAPGVVRAVSEAQRSSQALARRALGELHATWITPIDRHHIHELIEAFDGVLALIDSTAVRLDLFGIRQARPEANDLALGLCEACKRIRQVTDLLPKLSKGNAGEVMRLVGEIHEIEGQVNQTNRRALSSLFDGSSDPLTVMKWREVFDNFEKAMDLCRDLAMLFEAIVLENA
jgi:uncharacterized protein Yka (UPF0111/DUF47 family)